MQNSKFFLFLLIIAAGVFSCKKEDSNLVPPTTSDSTSTVSVGDKLKDSSLAYARDLYLWYDQIPDTFNARSYSDPNALMAGIRKYSRETGFANPVDRWSFGIKQAEWDNISSGIAGDFGLNVFFYGTGDLRVKLVEAESPAGKAGIRRGWRIVKINGNSNITTSNSSFIVENVYYSNSTQFTFQKPDGAETTISLSTATYKENPIVLDTVYNINNKKIGYMVFNSFLGDTTEIYNNFQRLFSNFSKENVSDVVIDLRYNGGGYVSVQNKLANYLVPSTGNGGVMMKQEYNKNYANYNSTTSFRKLGNLNLNRIFFIVSSSSASASELLINNLKPYMNVKLVGPSKTYGKPVGFFALPVGDWYVFPVSSRTINKNGEANYYNGFQLDYTVADGLNKDWGNVEETSLASALKYITTGSFRLQGTEAFRQAPEVVNGNKMIDAPQFKGAIFSDKPF